MVHFYKTFYYNIFAHLLTVNSKAGGLFGSIFTYFSIKKNSQRILYLYYLIWLYNAFYIF